MDPACIRPTHRHMNCCGKPMMACHVACKHSTQLTEESMRRATQNTASAPPDTATHQKHSLLQNSLFEHQETLHSACTDCNNTTTTEFERIVNAALQKKVAQITRKVITKTQPESSAHSDRIVSTAKESNCNIGKTHIEESDRGVQS